MCFFQTKSVWQIEGSKLEVLPHRKTVNLQQTTQGPERLAFLYFKVLVTSKVIRRFFFRGVPGKMGACYNML